MATVNLHCGRAFSTTGASLRLSSTVPVPAGQPAYNQAVAGFTADPYLVVEGIPRHDDVHGASIATRAGFTGTPTTFVGDQNTSAVPLQIGSTYRWLPRAEDIYESGARWRPMGLTTGPNIGLGGTPRPVLDAAFNYQGQYRLLPKPSIDFSPSGYGYLHVDNMPSATLCIVAVLNYTAEDYYGIFEANVSASGEPFVIRNHQGQIRIYQDEKLVVRYESESSVREPTIIMVSLDTATDQGRFLCIDRTRATRLFNISTMAKVGFTGILGGLGQGTTANPFRYFSNMEVLEIDLWDRALDTYEMLAAGGQLSMAYGVGA